MLRVRTDSADETREVAASIAPLLRTGDVLLLSGDLGAGKTTFLQALGAAMGVVDRITSPTFTLAHTYQGRLRLHHLDLFRLRNSIELMDLGLSELLSEHDSIVVVEWGELLASETLHDFLRIRFAIGTEIDTPETRWLDFEPTGLSWHDRLTALARVVGHREGG